MKCVLLKLLAVTMVISVIAVTPAVSQHHHTAKSDADTEKERLEALYWSRIEAAKMNFVQADVDFMTHMIPHHAQALIMSHLAPTNNASSVVQTLAARIINAQQDEIVTMQRWLRDRKQPVPIINLDGLVMTVTTEFPGEHDGHDMSSMSDVNKKSEMDHSTMNHNAAIDTSKMKSMDHSKMNHDKPMEKTNHQSNDDMNHATMDHSTMDHSNMAGMLTQEELNHLASVTGAEFDQAFLSYMIRHHQGAITMVNEMFAADGSGNDEDAYRLAADIYAEQLTEIERMKLMLNEMAVAPMPAQQHKH